MDHITRLSTMFVLLLASFSLHPGWKLLSLFHLQTLFRFELNLSNEPQPYLKRISQLTDNSLRVSFDGISGELNKFCHMARHDKDWDTSNIYMIMIIVI